MKKIITVAAVVVFIVGILTVTSLAAESKTVEVTVEGVPTMIIPADGVQVRDKNDGDKPVAVISKDELELTGKDDFNDEQNEVYEEVANTANKCDICDNLLEAVHSYAPDADPVNLDLWDIFDFDITGENANILSDGEGNKIELSFSCEISDDELIAIMIFSDGKWVALNKEDFDVEDNLLKIRFSRKGVVAILRYRGNGVSSPVVRPSVEIKDVPELEADDEIMTFSVWDTDIGGNVVWDIPTEEIALHPAAALEGEAKVAYHKLAETKSISALCSNFSEMLKLFDPNVKEDELVIKDVFEFALSGESRESLLAEEDNNVVLNFKYDVSEGDFFMVIQYVDGKWKALDPDFCWTADGQVGVRLRDDGLIAFIVKEEK